MNTFFFEQNRAYPGLQNFQFVSSLGQLVSCVPATRGHIIIFLYSF